MSVNDFKIEVYNTAGSSVISQLYVKTDGNVEAEFANPAALKDLITKEYADTSYATEDHNHDGIYAPDVHDHDNRYFQETEFIDESAGTADAGKPIVLDGNGLISDTMLDIATFIYQGNWTPTSGTEYPSTSGLDIGAFWTIDGLTGDYTFTGGDLAGEVITNDDLLIWGTEGWAMTKRDEDMSVYYKLDGSRAITDSFAGGGQQIKNIADATADSDAMTKGQADAAYAPIGIGGGDFYADGHVAMTGDFQGGGNKLTGIADATLDTDALTKGQADLAYEPIGGGGGDGDFMSDGSVAMTGGITFEAGNDNWISFYDTSESEQRVLIDADATGNAMTIALLPVSGSGDPGCQLRLDPGGNLSSSTQAPAIGQDFVTKTYGDANYLGGGGSFHASVGFDAVGGVFASDGVSSVVSSGGDSEIFYSVPMDSLEYYVTGACGGDGGTDDEVFFNIAALSEYGINSCKIRSVHASDNSSTIPTDVTIFDAYHPQMSRVTENLQPLQTDNIGVIENPDLSIKILNPAIGWSVQECFDQIGIVGNIMDRSNIPSNPALWSAWRLDSVGNTIYIDVEKVKELVIGENEKVAKRQLEALRPAFEEAYDMDDQFTLDLVKFDRQNIRADLTIKIANINACTTAAQVEAYLP